MSHPRAIAIVGLAGRFPGAPNVASLWRNVVNNVSASQPVASGRWPVPAADVVTAAAGVDQARSDRACLLEDFELDAPELDLPPALRPRLGRLSRLVLQVGAEAVRSAGLSRLPRARTGVVLANIALPTEGASQVAQAVLLGPVDQAVLGRSLAPALEPLDGLPSALPAGQLAQALGLGGGSFTLDAACASSLYAIYLSCLELESGRLDAVLTGGVSLPQPLYTQVGFTQLQALSPSGRCAPYDTRADGLVVGEGAGLVVLKRLADARAAGDTVLGIIRGIGLSNDVGGSLLSPEKEGQLRAMRAAYAEAGWAPQDVQLIEGHGTGTPRGDAVEVESLTALWSGASGARCVLGSVKSNVGHLLTAAGAAGLAKVVSALGARTLPPSAHSSPATLSPALAQGPFRVLQQAEPWPEPAQGPRRAAVSGFGFGGINAHLLIEAAASQPALEARSLELPRVALVGLATHVGPLDTLARFQHAVLRGDAVAQARPEWRWSGLGAGGPAPRGAWLSQFEVPAGRFKIPPRELESLLPQQVLMLKVVAEALADAGLSLRGPQLGTGVVVGLGLDLETTSFHLRWLARERVRQYEQALGASWSDEEREAYIAALADALADPLDSTRTLGALGGIVPSRVAREFQLGGPSFAVAGEASSGLRALSVATRLLQDRQADTMLVGAVDLAGDLRHVVVQDALRPYSKAGVARPFDARADGALLGEGAAAVVLRRLDDARAAGQRVYAVLGGLGAAGGGAGAQAIHAALREAQVAPWQVGLVVSGAAGDRAADAVESATLTEVFAGRAGRPEPTVPAKILHFPKGRAARKPDAASAVPLTEEVVAVEALSTVEALPADADASWPGAEEDVTTELPGGAFAGSRASPTPRRSPGFRTSRRSGLAAAFVDLRAPVGGAGLANGSGAGPEGFPSASSRPVGVVDGPSARFDVLSLRVEIEPSTAVTSTAAVVGHAGAASSLLSVVQAALSLFHEALPPLAGFESAPPGAGWSRSTLHAGRAPQGWLRDRAEGPRRALVTSQGLDGTAMAAVLEGLDRPPLEATAARARPWGERSAALFLLRGSSEADVQAQASRCAELAASWAGSLEQLAAAIWAEQRSGSLAVQRALVASDLAELQRALAAPWSPPPRATGEVAFVFPGSGNHYVGMGRALGVAMPEVYRALDAEVQHLRGHLMPAQFAPWRRDWSSGWEDEAQRALVSHPERIILGQVAHGVAVSDAVRAFGLTPRASLGYSLGESAGLFAARAWRDRDVMFGRTLTSPLFQSELNGDCTVIRDAWGQGARWQVVIVNRDAATVRAALRGTAALLIVNAPGECVVGGDRPDVDATVRALGCEALPLESGSIPTVHLPVMAPVADAYRALHVLRCTPPEGVRFYSGAWAQAYVPTPEAAAQSIVDNALRGFDFPALIEQAWRDGVRTFVELGPQGSCTRMLARILAGRSYTAVSACLKGTDGFRTLLSSVGRLAEAGLHVSLDCLYAEGRVPALSPAPPPGLPVRLGRRRPPVPRWPRVETKAPVALAPVSGPVAGLLALTQATASAHEAFLAVSQQNFALQAQWLSSLASGAPTPVLPPVTSRPAPRFDRAQCLEFAIGSLSRMLGPTFAEVDAYPTRVRLPAEPLMLVDRIVEVEGEMGSLTRGRVVTEHDVLPGAWYLDGGRVPTCISVEAGQADLFLSGYLGIDLRTKGQKVYRLLDAKIVLHRDLPRPGEVLRYDIAIDRFICQGDTWLFFFRFDGTIDGQPFITMYDGCAGFFGAEQLASGRGIVDRAEPKASPRRTDATTGQPAAPYTPLLPLARATLDEAQVDALRGGDLQAAFGPAFAGKHLAPALRLPTGRMKLVDTITELDPHGGAAGLGLVVGEHAVTPDAWYLTCHFIDDQVMPGTLMYECCLHTLRCLLLRLGWVSDDEALDLHTSPVEGVASQLKCRGQVTASTKRVTYRVEVKELGYDPEPYVIATASMYADGRHVVQMENMSLQVRGLTRQRLEATWKPSAATAPRFTREQIVAYAEGNPSECFGEPYRPFDHGRRLARLPRDPFLFVDRVLSVDAPPWQVAPGGWVECTFDVQPDAWYFGAFRQPTMPLAVLLEAALQPCGWLAAYVGSALLSDEDLQFRNLDGQATQHLAVTPDVGTLTTRARLTKTSQAGGMLLQDYEMEVLAQGRKVYSGTTGFGFFSKAALAQQAGVRGATAWTPGAQVRPVPLPMVGSAQPLAWRGVSPPGGLALPGRAWAMVDTLEVLDLTGGSKALGFVQACKRVDPAEWFFQAHFFQDPVMPGSLGLEAFVQALQLFARERFGSLVETHRFEVLALGQTHRWQYRGQVLQQTSLVTVQAEITRVEEGPEPLVVANGQLLADGKVIYVMKDFGLRLKKETPR